MNICCADNIRCRPWKQNHHQCWRRWLSLEREVYGVYSRTSVVWTSVGVPCGVTIDSIFNGPATEDRCSFGSVAMGCVPGKSQQSLDDKDFNQLMVTISLFPSLLILVHCTLFFYSVFMCPMNLCQCDY